MRAPRPPEMWSGTPMLLLMYLQTYASSPRALLLIWRRTSALEMWSGVAQNLRSRDVVWHSNVALDVPTKLTYPLHERCSLLLTNVHILSTSVAPDLAENLGSSLALQPGASCSCCKVPKPPSVKFQGMDPPPRANPLHKHICPHTARRGLESNAPRACAADGRRWKFMQLFVETHKHICPHTAPRDPRSRANPLHEFPTRRAWPKRERIKTISVVLPISVIPIVLPSSVAKPSRAILQRLVLGRHFVCPPCVPEEARTST